MRIGIDARFLTHPQQGGFKTYTTNLIEALSKLNDGDQYVIYLDRLPANQETLPQSDSFTYKVVPLRLPGLGMAYREQVDLKKQIRQDKLDLVHFLCNSAPINITQNYVVTLHDIIQITNSEFVLRRNLAEQKQWALRAYSKWAIKKTVPMAKRVLTVSHYEKEKIRRGLNIPPEQISVTHLAHGNIFHPAGPDTIELFRKQVQDKFGLKGKFILGLGYEPRKNIPLLIRSFSTVAAKCPDINLVIVAAHEERRKYFQKLGSELGLEERIVILGKVLPEDLVQLYNLAELFVFPSERESFGLPPLEALACGTPTIAMNMASLPEILGEGALLLDGRDEELWGDTMLQVLSNYDLRKQLINRGLKQASLKNWEACAHETIKVYHSVA